MRNFLKATFSGLALGIAVFLLVGWCVYSVLWHVAGMDNIPPDSNPAVVLGGVWALGWGVIVGAALGLVSWLLFAIYLYRRCTPRTVSR